MSPIQTLIQKPRFTLARVRLNFSLPLLPRLDVYSYLLSNNRQITILDTGPQDKTNQNLKTLLMAINQLFHHQPVKRILISHNHLDHAQNAIPLQQALKTRQKNTPPIYIHHHDLFPPSPQPKHLLLGRHLIKAARSSRYIRSFKTCLRLPDINSDLCHAPGHTPGFSLLLNRQHRFIIRGWWPQELRHPLIKTGLKLLNSSNQDLAQSAVQFAYPNYTHYHLHPSPPKPPPPSNLLSHNRQPRPPM